MVGQEDEGEEDEYLSHKVSYWWFRRTQYIPQFGRFYKNRGFYLEVSDCEELVGVTHRR